MNRQPNGNNRQNNRLPGKGIKSQEIHEPKKRKSRRSAVIAAVVAGTAISAAVVAVILTMLLGTEPQITDTTSDIQTELQTSAPEETTVEVTEEVTQETTTESCEPITSEEPDIIETAELPPEEETTAPEETTEAYEPVLYNFASPVPESEAVELSYFYDTVFIGDSRTQGLVMYTRLKPKYNFAAQSANVTTLRVRSYITLTEEDGSNRNYTLLEALERENGNYKSIYISSGINELGWNVNRYISEYELLIDMIREISDVPIYVQLILPVTTEFEQNNPGGLSNAKAALFNERLRLMAAEKELFILDPTALHALEDGSLDPQYSFDGAHLYSGPYEDIVEYYRTHTVDIEMYDNLRKAPDEAPCPEGTDCVTEEICPETEQTHETVDSTVSEETTGVVQ